MKNEEKAVVTDLSQIIKEEENKPYLDFAKLIIEEIKQGKTKDEILQRILNARGGLEADQREMKYFTDMVDIVYEWYSKNSGNEFQTAVRELLTSMEENQKYLYKGKDGKDYATRTELEAANEMYRKNQNRLR